tara:strand:- start:395 stop:871 length:477 start_codon:yes stop_codon:yes gene_type:complete
MFWVLLALIHSGCGQSGETSSKVSDSSLVGVWRGTYTNLLEAAPENTYEVDLDLQSDGGFLLRHLETGNSASGAYTENGGITYFLSGKISYTDTSGGWAGVSLHIEEALPTMVFSQLSFKISKSPQNVNNGMLYISGHDQNLAEELQPIKCRRAVRDI